MLSLDRLTGERLDRFRVLILPDFFIDRIVKIPSLEAFLKEVERKKESGGGSIRRVEQLELRGGNASNVAYALGRLGVSVNLMAVADSSSTDFLWKTFSDLPNVQIDIIEGKPGYTVALEFPYGGRLVNVMLSDVGDVADVGPNRIPDGYRASLPETTLAGVFNWASNRKGTELAETVFSEASRKGVQTYFAPADISERRDEVPELFRRLRGILTVLSINENEARIIAKSLSIDHLPIDYRPDDTVRCTAALSKTIDARVDLHTPFGSASASADQTHFAATFDVERRVCTGGGDVWDAGNIVGSLLELEPDQRLKLANAAAALYISSVNAEPPSAKTVSSFLEKIR